MNMNDERPARDRSRKWSDKKHKKSCGSAEGGGAALVGGACHSPSQWVLGSWQWEAEERRLYAIAPEARRAGVGRAAAAETYCRRGPYKIAWAVPDSASASACPSCLPHPYPYSYSYPILPVIDYLSPQR